MESNSASTSSEDTTSLPLLPTEQKHDLENDTQATPACSRPGETGTSDVDAFEVLLERQRSERMFELRRLKLGDRAVTGQNHRQTLDRFFSGEEDAVTSRSHRPDPVQVEITALFERRPVTSLIRSEVIRRRLESALRQPGGGQQSRPIPVPRAAVPAPPLPPSTRQPNNRLIRPAPTNVGTVAGQLLARSLATRRAEVIPSDESEDTEDTDDEWEDDAEDDTVTNTSEIRTQTAPHVSQVPLIPPPPPPPMNHSNTTENRELERSEHSYRDVLAEAQRIQRDSIIHSISELVDRELVTSALNGEIGEALEALLQRRVRTTDSDGVRVAQFIRSLPPSRHVRNNELSDQQIVDDLSDSLSMVSATAVVRDPTSSAMRRELTDLRGEVSELKRLMQRSLEMQMDIQRSIRQEVAAAVAGSNTNFHQPPRTSLPVHQDGICLICLEKSTDTVLYRCGHLCLCHACAMELRHRNGRCPICRAPINDLVRVYKAGLDS